MSVGILSVFYNSALESDLEMVREDKEKLEEMLRYSSLLGNH